MFHTVIHMRVCFCPAYLNRSMIVVVADIIVSTVLVHVNGRGSPGRQIGQILKLYAILFVPVIIYCCNQTLC